MKKSLIAVTLLALVIFSSAGVAYAWFSAQVKVRGVSVSVADSGLTINGLNEINLALNYADIYPGWKAEPIPFTLENTSDQNIPMEIKATVLFSGVNYEALAGTINMAIEPAGTTSGMTFMPLSEWVLNKPIIKNGRLEPGQSANYEIFFMLDPAADNSIQNIDLGISVLFTGTQTNIQ